MISRVFLDDSHIGQPPVYALAGWIADIATWTRFCGAWDDVLRMSPRIEYFKFEEANNFSGQFFGMSPQKRDEKLKLLAETIRGHKLHGIASLMYSSSYDFMRDIAPSIYGCMFIGLAKAIVMNCDFLFTDTNSKIDFILDIQPGAMDEIEENWRTFTSTAPPEYGRLLLDHPPTFQDDKLAKPLQAADLHAGWVHKQALHQYLGTPQPEFAWSTVKGIRRTIYFFSDSDAQTVVDRATKEGWPRRQQANKHKPGERTGAA